MFFFFPSQMEVAAGPAQRRNDAAGPAQRRNDLLDEKGPSRRWGVVIAVATAAFTGCALWLRADGSLLMSTRGLRQEDAVMRTGELWAKLGAGAQALSLRKQRESCCQEGMIAQVCMNTYIFLIGIPYHSQRCPRRSPRTGKAPVGISRTTLCIKISDRYHRYGSYLGTSHLINLASM
jgi:hypothetical protein